MTCIAVDTETTGLAFYDEAFGASVADDLSSEWYELPSQAEALRERLLQADELVFHNAKFDLQKLYLAGVLPRRTRVPGFQIHDTEALAHLLDEHRPKRLKYLAREVLGLETDEDTALAKVRRELKLKKSDGYHLLPREIVVPYALKDVEFTWALFKTFYPKVMKYEDLAGLYAMEMDLTWALLDMEADGLGVDLPYTEKQAKAYASAIVKAEWKIEDATGLKVWYPEKPGQKTPEGCFNPNAPPQIKAFYQSIGIERGSYDKFALAEIDDDFAKALLELRKLKKIYGTYLTAMLHEQRDGILHPHTRQHNTVTGRMSSGKAES